MREVIAPKAGAIQALGAATAAEPFDFAAGFSSVSALAGKTHNL